MLGTSAPPAVEPKAREHAVEPVDGDQKPSLERRQQSSERQDDVLAEHELQVVLPIEPDIHIHEEQLWVRSSAIDTVLDESRGGVERKVKELRRPQIGRAS